MGAESGMNSSVRDDRVALSDGAKALWGKTNRIDDSEWLPLYVHMVDSAAMASKIWDTWVPQGTKAVIVGDLGNDEVLARKLMIFMAGIHDIGKATPVFQAKSITFGPEAGSFAWKAERAGLPMIAGLRGTNHPTHPIAGEIILEGYLLRVRGWERKAARQYACVVGGHHGTPPDKSKIDEEKNRKTNVGLDSEAWVSTQDELIDFVANIAGIEEKEWEDLSERRFSVQSAVLMTGLVIMADWIASNSDEDMFPLVRTEPWADEDEDFFFSESGEEDDIQSWSGLRIRADRAWSCVQLPHAWVPEGIPSSCQDLFATRFTLPEGAKVRPVQEEAVRIARDTRQPGLMVIEAPMGEGKTEAALAAAEILAQRTGRGGVCVALPTMATTDAMFTRVRRWLEALPSCDFDNEKTVWLAHGKAQLNNDLRDQLQDDSATVEGVVAFVEAFVKSMPSGKQNTFANHTLPEDVVVTLRESQPISAADAFEDPVRRKDGISVSRQGVERLGERLNDIRVNYGEEPVKAWYVATGGAVSSLNEWCEQVSLPDLEQSLKETLNAAYSA